MVTINQNNYDLILAETIKLFQIYGALLIDTNKYSTVIAVSKEALEYRRANGRGITYIKFGLKEISPVRYRIDHIIAEKYGYTLSTKMSKKLLLDVLSTKNVELFSLKEAASLYDFEKQKMSRDINKRKSEKAVNYPLVAPRQSNKPGTNYQFHRDNIVDHICGLTYTLTMS